MYLVNKEQNSISEIDKKTFKELKIEERRHLQEWIVSQPNLLGEELLIIQKEFSNFKDTNERLDLLALDKKGNLVIIENKLDDSGKEVIGQALKYAAYCSTLKKEEIIGIYQDYLNLLPEKENAEENLLEFFKQVTLTAIALNTAHSQRIILLAREFRKEVTATVLWLSSKIKVQCFKITPYQVGEHQLIDFEQIIPLKEAQEYIIKMAEKSNEDAEDLAKANANSSTRINFWLILFEKYKTVSKSFQGTKPSKDSWVGVSAGITGVVFNFVISNSYARVELYIGTPNRDQNKVIYNSLLDQRKELEKTFGSALIWEELPHRKASRIKLESQDFNILMEDKWDEIAEYLTDTMLRFENTFRKPISSLKGSL